jgi:hypothetical protein
MLSRTEVSFKVAADHERNVYISSYLFSTNPFTPLTCFTTPGIMGTFDAEEFLKQSEKLTYVEPDSVIMTESDRSVMSCFLEALKSRDKGDSGALRIRLAAILGKDEDAHGETSAAFPKLVLFVQLDKKSEEETGDTVEIFRGISFRNVTEQMANDFTTSMKSTECKRELTYLIKREMRKMKGDRSGIQILVSIPKFSEISRMTASQLDPATFAILENWEKRQELAQEAYDELPAEGSSNEHLAISSLNI